MEKLFNIANEYYIIFLIAGCIMILALIGYVSSTTKERTLKPILKEKKVTLKEEKNTNNNIEEEPTFAFEEK